MDGAQEFTWVETSKRWIPKTGSPVAKYFGRPNDDGEYDPERGLLAFTDFHTDQVGDPDHVIDRIQIDPTTQTVQNRMLKMIQAPFKYGEPVTFSGHVDFIASDDDAEWIREAVEQAIRWVPAFGAMRTVGFGRTKFATCKLSKAAQRINGSPPATSSLPIRLKLDRPLCIVGRKHSQNHFESEVTISGTVLKGSIARMIQQLLASESRDVSDIEEGGFQSLREHFSQLHFCEARPMKAGAQARPIEPPLSVVTVPTIKHRYFDVALDDEASHVGGAAVAFMPDWKSGDFETVRGAFGWSLLPKERRTRTAINPKTGRAADEMLFSYGLVLPEKGDDRYVWEGRIELGAIPENEHVRVRNELQQLLANGITGIGKTRAIASVEWLSSASPPVVKSTEKLPKNQVVVTLQTECLMNNPVTLQKSHPDPLRESYVGFWHDVSKGALKLTRFFARQSLYGGYVSRRAKSSLYEPFLLTDRGSAFVLELVDSSQAEKWFNDK